MIDYQMTFGPEHQDVLIGIGMQFKAYKKQLLFWRIIMGLLGLFLLGLGIFGRSTFVIVCGVIAIAVMICIVPIQKKGLKQLYKKQDSRISQGSRRYEIDDSGIRITSYQGINETRWDAYVARGTYQHYVWLQRADRNVVVLDLDCMTAGQQQELQGYLTKHLPQA